MNPTPSAPLVFDSPPSVSSPMWRALNGLQPANHQHPSPPGCGVPLVFTHGDGEYRLEVDVQGRWDLSGPFAPGTGRDGTKLGLVLHRIMLDGPLAGDLVHPSLIAAARGAIQRDLDSRPVHSERDLKFFLGAQRARLRDRVESLRDKRDLREPIAFNAGLDAAIAIITEPEPK